MTFIDLFAGLGGFHVALKRLGHDCVFASEIKEDLRTLYKKNFGIDAHGDIRLVAHSEIPRHDILCAGFPCQPFSKAGDQQGLKCPRWGRLFNNVVKILDERKPKHLILENVPNLVGHNNGMTWKAMKRKLENLGYTVDDHRLSPHQFGIPQIRDRVYIVGSRSGLDQFEWPVPENGKIVTDITSVLDANPNPVRRIRQNDIHCLNIWQDFVRMIPRKEPMPGFPIWSMEFGATYPYETCTPASLGTRGLCNYRGSHGIVLRDLPADQRINALPSHARGDEKKFPDWKIKYIRKNREFYARHKKWIAEWIPEILPFHSSFQKLEWHSREQSRTIWNYIIQFRASGVRVKLPTSSPSLVAMNTSQVPVIGWQKRYITPRECARLQSLCELKHLPETISHAFSALGNAVNADVVEMIVKSLLRRKDKGVRHRHSDANSRNARQVA